MTKNATTIAIPTLTPTEVNRPYGVERFNKAVRKARKAFSQVIAIVPRGISPTLVVGATSIRVA